MKQIKNYNNWLKYSSYAFQLIVMIAAAVYGGIKLDEKWELSPLLTISLPLLVLGVTFYKLIKDTNQKRDVKK